MKNWLMGLALILPTLLSAEIIETNNIEDVYPHVEEGAFVLLGMTDTITESTLSLGSKPWRQFVRRNLRKIQDLEQPGNLHDQWTFYVATSVPVKPVQKETVEWIDKLQKEEVPVFCITGRGRNVWYSSIYDKVDKVTEFQLGTMKIDFTKSKVPEELKKISSRQFHNGVFYADPYAHGEFLDQILLETGYRPTKIIMVDDKWEQLKSVEEKLTEAGIPHVCVHYQRAEKERKDFNPLVSLVQLESLLKNNFAVSEEEAIEKASKLENPSADEFFKELVEKYGNLN